MRLVAEVLDGRDCSSWLFSTRCNTASAPRLRVSSSSSSPAPFSSPSCFSSSSPPAPSSGKVATHSSTVTGERDLVLDNKLHWGKHSDLDCITCILAATHQECFPTSKGKRFKKSQPSMDFKPFLEVTQAHLLTECLDLSIACALSDVINTVHPETQWQSISSITSQLPQLHTLANVTDLRHI